MGSPMSKEKSKEKLNKEKFFLGRQPILNQDQHIIGFEFLFRSADLAYADISSYMQASASVMINALSDFGMQQVMGRHKGFFNVTAEVLMSDAVELLPKEQVVLELLETIEIDATIIKRCRDLKALGFTLALDDCMCTPGLEPLYELVNIVKLDILQIPGRELPGMVKRLRAWPLTLLAEKVETAEQYAFCCRQGFELFQGYYFARPVVLKQKRVDVTKIALMRLLEQVLVDAEILEIERTFKSNPNLTYHLLRLVNSVGIGLREKIKSLRHALVVLGLKQLKRWILLALFAYNDVRGVKSPLLEMAAMRGRLMEQLARKQSEPDGDRDYADRAFMTGLLSLVDVLFEVTMEEMVNQLNLNDDIRQALLTREGPLGNLLLVAEKLEEADFHAVGELLGQSELNLDHLFYAQLEAINWVNGMGESV